MSLVPFCFWADMAVLGSSWNFAILLNCDTLEGVFLKCFHRQKNLKKESVGMTWFNFQLPECSSRHTSEADRTSCEPIATIQNLENRDNYRNGIFTSPDQVLVNRCSGKEVHVFQSRYLLICAWILKCQFGSLLQTRKKYFFRVWNWKKIKWHSIFQKSSGERQGLSWPRAFPTARRTCLTNR